MGYKKDIYKAVSITKDAIDDPYRRIAAEIIIGAISDWRLLIEKRAWDKSYLRLHDGNLLTFEAIRRFFNGEWCEFLMQFFSVEPARVLEQLEKELQEAMADEEAGRRKRRKRCNK